MAYATGGEASGLDSPLDGMFDLVRHINDNAIGGHKLAQAFITRTKEVLAIGIAIAVRCEGCIGFHVKAAMRAGAMREEVLETISMAIYMGAGPSMIYAAETLRAFDELAAVPA